MENVGNVIEVNEKEGYFIYEFGEFEERFGCADSFKSSKLKISMDFIHWVATDKPIEI